MRRSKMDVPLGTLKPQRHPSLVLGFVNVKTSKKRREGLTCYTTRLNGQSDQSSYDLTSTGMPSKARGCGNICARTWP